jgi:uncharacterized protein (DUF1697 family)
MTTYIALLRGINVGGKNKIKMAELKSALVAIELSRVQTYIQSGNVVFESGEGAVLLRGRIEQEIKEAFGIPAAVVLRTAAELERIITDCPFAADALSEGESLQVCLLTETPSQDKVDRLSEGKSEIDEYQVQGREVYLLFRQSVLDSKLASNIPKLGVTATTRNWNTINKLLTMAKSMQA